MNIIYRTDSSVKIGTGHVMRCLSLAKALQKEGAQVKFICRDLFGNISDQIITAGFELLLLSSPDNIERSDQCVNEIDEWLGLSWKLDVQEVMELLDNEKPDWLIIDSYGIDYRWHQHIRPYVNKIMVVDDLANRKLDCDLLLDQNFYINPDNRYSSLLPPNCKVLFGPEYMLLRDEFFGVNRRDCLSRANINNIVVFMGGADPSNETQKALLALEAIWTSSLTANVIVGNANPHSDQIEQMCKKRVGFEFYKGIGNISEFFSRADLAIGAGGVAALERCFVGLPSLTVVTANNQEETTLALDSIGAIRYLGWNKDVDQRILSEHITLACENEDMLQSMCKKSLSLFGDKISNLSNVTNEILNNL